MFRDLFDKARAIAEELQRRQVASQEEYAQRRHINLGELPQHYTNSDVETPDDDRTVENRNPDEENVSITVGGTLGERVGLLRESDWLERAEDQLTLYGRAILANPRAFENMLHCVGGYPETAGGLTITEKLFTLESTADLVSASVGLGAYARSDAPTTLSMSATPVVSNGSLNHTFDTTPASDAVTSSVRIIPFPSDIEKGAFYINSCIIQRVHWSGECVPFTVHLARKNTTGEPLLVNPCAGAIVRTSKRVIDPNLYTISTPQLAPVLCVSRGVAISLDVAEVSTDKSMEHWTVGSIPFFALAKFALEVADAPRDTLLDILRRHDGERLLVPTRLASDVKRYINATSTAAPVGDWCLVIRPLSTMTFPSSFCPSITLHLSYFLNTGT